MARAVRLPLWHPMTYEEAKKYLEGFVNYERQPLDAGKRGAMDLSRVRELAARLGDPQLKYPTLHIAGTKGKGSACAFAAAILQAAGLKVGLYTSPHLVSMRERIAVNGQKISRESFALLMDLLKPHLEELRARSEVGRKPTYFEIFTHLAFLYFQAKQIDAAVIEVGLGGRLDATSIVAPDACGITHIGFDHTAILGDTLDLIAREKAGILKPDVPCVSAPQHPEAARALRVVAESRGTPLQFIGPGLHLAVVPRRPPGEDAPLCGPAAMLQLAPNRQVRADLALPGKYQAENWAVAVALADALHLKRRGGPLPDAAIAAGSRNVAWPGRLEEVRRSAAGARVFLDGAHNDSSIEAVLSELAEMLPKRRPLVVLFACAKDKNAAAMFDKVQRHTREVVFTYSGNQRGKTAADLAALWKEKTGGTAAACELKAGLAEAERRAGAQGMVLATGSLYLVGALKELLTPGA